MIPRERMLAALVALLFVGGAGAFFYVFFYKDYTDLSKRLTTLDRELKNKSADYDKAVKEDIRLLDVNRLSEECPLYSLPGPEKVKDTPGDTNHTNPDDHINRVRVEYGNWLLALMEKYKFTQTKVTPRVQEVKVGSSAQNKSAPPYTRVAFQVEGRGSYKEVLEMLTEFYATPLLHEVRLLDAKVAKTTPVAARAAAPGDFAGGAKGKGKGKGGADPAAGPGGAKGKGKGKGGAADPAVGPGGAVAGAKGFGGAKGKGKGAFGGGAFADPAVPDEAAAVEQPAVGAKAGPGGGRGGRGGASGEELLELRMDVEAIMVKDAPYRATLIPKDVPKEDSLVVSELQRDYGKIPDSRDIFFGSHDRRGGTGDGPIVDDGLRGTGRENNVPTEEYQAVMSFVKLTMIWKKEGEKPRWYATFYNQGKGFQNVPSTS